MGPAPENPREVLTMPTLMVDGDLAPGDVDAAAIGVREVAAAGALGGRS
jgi:hypothetical protein